MAKQIEVGKKYINKGSGRTWREVLEIGSHIKPKWWGAGDPPNDPGVRYIDSKGVEGCLYLKSFKQWAGEEVVKF